MNRKRGFTLIELLVVMSIIAVLLSLLLPALSQARAKAKQLKDSTQIKQIHESWLFFAREADGIFPTPGLIDRLQDPVIGQHLPGRGPQDYNVNDHAKLYSACISQNYFTPDLCVSPSEPSGVIVAKADYNWDIYNPIADYYWDDDTAPNAPESYTSFALDLEGLNEGICNASYAIMPIAQTRATRQWRESLDDKFAIIGNRGVEDGSLDENDYNDSLTLGIHGARDWWFGNICFNDNHVSYEDVFLPEGVTYVDASGESRQDNLFYNDSEQSSNDPGGDDSWLVMCSEVTGSDIEVTSLTLQWD